MATTQITAKPARRPRTRRTFPVTVTRFTPQPAPTTIDPSRRWVAIHDPFPQAVGQHD